MPLAIDQHDLGSPMRTKASTALPAMEAQSQPSDIAQKSRLHHSENPEARHQLPVKCGAGSGYRPKKSELGCQLGTKVDTQKTVTVQVVTQHDRYHPLVISLYLNPGGSIQQSQVCCMRHRGGPVCDVQFFQDFARVESHRVRRDQQNFGNDRDGFSCCSPYQNFPLPIRQLLCQGRHDAPCIHKTQKACMGDAGKPVHAHAIFFQFILGE